MLDVIASHLGEEGHLVPTDRKNLLGLVDRLFAESYDGGPVAPSSVQTPAWVPPLFAAYCTALVAANRLDFGGLLHFTRRLLRERPRVARVLAWAGPTCCGRIPDTNKAQYDLLRLIVPRRSRICSWSQTTTSHLPVERRESREAPALQRDYQMEVVQLPESYRCPPEIIDLANRLIGHNRLRTEDKKPLTTSRTASLG